MNSPETKRNLFLVCMEAMKSQHGHDVEFANAVSKMYDDAEIPVYNNCAIVAALVKLLSQFFDNHQESEHAINNFMYAEDLGRKTDRKASDLWDELWERDWSEFFNT